MKTTLKNLIFVCFGALLFVGCDKSSSSKIPTDTSSSLKLHTDTRSGLKLRTEYKNFIADSPYSSTIYVFSEKSVSVYKEVGKGEDVCIQNSNKKLVTSREMRALKGVGAKMGTALSRRDDDPDAMVVLFGPGDRVPVLQSAPYRIEGTSVQIDWSQNHSEYFDIGRCDSSTEVFTIKNEGLILDSATTSGFTLTAALNN